MDILLGKLFRYFKKIKISRWSWIWLPRL